MVLKRRVKSLIQALSSLKKSYTFLREYFIQHFGSEFHEVFDEKLNEIWLKFCNTKKYLSSDGPHVKSHE